MINDVGHAFYFHVEDGVFAFTQNETSNVLMHEAADALRDVGLIVVDRPRLLLATRWSVF